MGVTVALQAARPTHLGVDNANVVGHVGRIITRKEQVRLFEPLVDGDLLSLVIMLILARGAGTTAISKVKGHADEGLVREKLIRLPLLGSLSTMTAKGAPPLIPWSGVLVPRVRGGGFLMRFGILL